MTTLESFPSVLIIRTSCVPLHQDDGDHDRRRRPSDTTTRRTENGSTGTTKESTKLPFSTSATTTVTADTSTKTISAPHQDNENTDKDGDSTILQQEQQEQQEAEYRLLFEDFQATLPLSCDITVIPELQDFLVDFSGGTPTNNNHNHNHTTSSSLSKSSKFKHRHHHHHDATAAAAIVDKRRGTDPILDKDISDMLQLSQQPLNPCGSDNVLLLPELVSDTTLASTLLQGGFLLSLTNCHATLQSSIKATTTTTATNTNTKIPIQASPSTYSFHLGDNDIVPEEEGIQHYPSSTQHSSSPVVNSHGAFAALTIDFDFNAQQDILRKHLQEQHQQQHGSSLTDLGSSKSPRHDDDNNEDEDTWASSSSITTTMKDSTTSASSSSSTDRHVKPNNRAVPPTPNPTFLTTPTSVPESSTVLPDSHHHHSHHNIVSLVNNVVIREQEYLESLLWKLGLVVVLLMMLYVWLAYQLVVLWSSKTTKTTISGLPISTSLAPEEKDDNEKKEKEEHLHKEPSMILVDGTNDSSFWKTTIIYDFVFFFCRHVSNRWKGIHTKITNWYSRVLVERKATTTIMTVRRTSTNSSSSSPSSSTSSSLWDDKSSSNTTITCTTNKNVNSKVQEKGEKDGNDTQKTQNMTDDDVDCMSTGKTDDVLLTTRTTQPHEKEKEETSLHGQQEETIPSLHYQTQAQVNSSRPHHVGKITDSFVGATTSTGSLHCEDIQEELLESKDSTCSPPPMAFVTLEHPDLINTSPSSSIDNDKEGQDSKSQYESSNNFRSSTTFPKVGLPSEQQQLSQVLSRSYVQQQQQQQEQQKAKVRGDNDLIVGSFPHGDDDCESTNRDGENNIITNSNLSPCAKLKRTWQESKHHRRSTRKGRKENSLSPFRPLVIRTPITTPATTNNNDDNTPGLPGTNPKEQSKNAQDFNATNLISSSAPHQVDATPPPSILVLETPSTNDTNSTHSSETFVLKEQQQEQQNHPNTKRSATSIKSNHEDSSNYSDRIHPQEGKNQQKQHDEKTHTLQSRNLDASFLEDYWGQ